jgi:hypothetical protein
VQIAQRIESDSIQQIASLPHATTYKNISDGIPIPMDIDIQNTLPDKDVKGRQSVFIAIIMVM